MRELLTTIRRIWQPIACRLRRRGALISLFVALSLGLLEPLACVTHCAIIELLGTGGVAHLHHHHAQAAAGTLGAARPAPPGPLCAGMAGGTSSASPGCSLILGQPFHEMLLLAVVALLIQTTTLQPLLGFVLRKTQHHPRPISPPPIRLHMATA